MKKFYEKWTGRTVNRDLFRDLLTLAAPALIYAALYMVWFMALEKHTFSHYSIIHTAVDDLIPFNEIFVIPYYTWFLYVVLAVIMVTLKNVTLPLMITMFFGAAKCDEKKLAKIYFSIIGTLMLVAFSASQLGIIEDRMLNRYRDGVQVEIGRAHV